MPDALDVLYAQLTRDLFAIAKFLFLIAVVLGGALKDEIVVNEWSTQSPANNGSNRPYIDHPTCPRKPELAGNRKCLKKCRSDLECRGRNRKCFCDDVCGKSCVRPSKLQFFGGINPLMGTLKLLSNGPYRNTMIGTLAVDGWLLHSVGSAKLSEEGPEWAAAPPCSLLSIPNVTAHPSTASVSTSYYSMWHYNFLCTPRVKLTLARKYKICPKYLHPLYHEDQTSVSETIRKPPLVKA